MVWGPEADPFVTEKGEGESLKAFAFWLLHITILPRTTLPARRLSALVNRTRRTVSIFNLCLSVHVPQIASADDNGFFLRTRHVFRPLEGRPPELQYAFRHVIAGQPPEIGEAAIGDYLGIYRWGLPGQALFSVGGGGVFGRFDLSKYTKRSGSVDWYLICCGFSDGAVVFPSHALPYQLAFGGRLSKKNAGDHLQTCLDNLQGLVSLDAGRI